MAVQCAFLRFQLIVSFSPPSDGSLPPEQVAAASTLGAYVKGCYGTPAAATSGSGSMTYTLAVPAGVTVDRVVVAEDQSHGQLIRAFTLTSTLTNGTTVDVAKGSRCDLAGGRGSLCGCAVVVSSARGGCLGRSTHRCTRR